MAHWSLMILQFWIDRVNFKGLERIQKDRKGHTEGPEMDQKGTRKISGFCRVPLPQFALGANS